MAFTAAEAEEKANLLGGKDIVLKSQAGADRLGRRRGQRGQQRGTIATAPHAELGSTDVGQPFFQNSMSGQVDALYHRRHKFVFLG